MTYEAYLTCKCGEKIPVQATTSELAAQISNTPESAMCDACLDVLQAEQDERLARLAERE